MKLSKNLRLFLLTLKNQEIFIYKKSWSAWKVCSTISMYERIYAE